MSNHILPPVIQEHYFVLPAVNMFITLDFEYQCVSNFSVLQGALKSKNTPIEQWVWVLRCAHIIRV
jgi:hypothetical protein